MYGIQRREFIKGGTALTAMALLHASRAYAYPGRPGEAVIPWLDQPIANPDPVGIQAQLVARWGKDILDDQGHPDRKKIGRIVFASTPLQILEIFRVIGLGNILRFAKDEASSIQEFA